MRRFDSQSVKTSSTQKLRRQTFHNILCNHVESLLHLNQIPLGCTHACLPWPAVDCPLSDTLTISHPLPKYAPYQLERQSFYTRKPDLE